MIFAKDKHESSCLQVFVTDTSQTIHFAWGFQLFPFEERKTAGLFFRLFSLQPCQRMSYPYYHYRHVVNSEWVLAKPGTNILSILVLG
jgi:hypothetical protein